MPDVTDHIDAIHAAATETRTRWGYAVTYTDGATRYRGEVDEEAAAIAADAIATNLADPGRRPAANDVTAAAVVRREAFTLPDGTEVVRPWEHVRDGRSQWDDEGEAR